MRLHRKVLLLTVLLVLSGLSGLSWVVNPAHAGTSITFRSVVKNFCNPCTSLVSPSLTIAVSGDALIVAIYGEGAFNNFALSDTQGNSYTERVSSIAGSGTAASTYIFTTLANGAGGDVLTVTTGGASRIFGYSFMDYSNVLGFGVTATDQQDSAGASAVSTVTLTNTQGSGSAIVENLFTTGFGGGGTSAVLTNNQGQTVRDSGGTNPCAFNAQTICESTDFPAAATTFALSITVSWTGGIPPYPLSHSALELTGVSTAATTTVLQCLGNCGNPAITLANTNSTHTINFNQSITLLYEFQSPFTGFILNVTTNMAKTYNNGEGVIEAIYTVPSCPFGQTPFTQQCPGYLASGWNVIGNPGKGRLTNGNYRIPIANGQWAGITITAVFSGLDLNDTNTNVAIFQTQGGGCACPPPATITQAALFNGASKIGLWAWIEGNIISSQPPPVPSSPSCFGLDCILTNAVNSFCTIVTTPCQTGSSLFWIIVLTIISVVAIVFSFAQILPEANIGRMGIGELAILIFVGWVVIFTSFNLLSIYVLLLTFFIVAALSAKTVRGYVGV